LIELRPNETFENRVTLMRSKRAKKNFSWRKSDSVG
jgi:hypothetical protein